MGEVLIAGMAAMLICIFLGPKFIEYLRLKEFGQHIREEGPQEHHAKAGTPTMGGIIIFTAIAVPFLLLTDLDARSVGVMGEALACAALGFAASILAGCGNQNQGGGSGSAPNGTSGAQIAQKSAQSAQTAAQKAHSSTAPGSTAAPTGGSQ